MQTTPGRLGAAREVIADATTEILLSSVSSWEIAMKWALGKLDLPQEPALYVPERMQRSAAGGLAFTHTHALAAGQLPLHHRDPFDRALVAQAQSEKLTLVTADQAIRDYDVDLLWIPN